jgi:hypothetical protein
MTFVKKEKSIAGNKEKDESRQCLSSFSLFM